MSKTRAVPAIRIRGARTHNLQNVSVDSPIGRLTVITGVSAGAINAAWYAGTHGSLRERAERELGDASRWRELQATAGASEQIRRKGQPAHVSDLVTFLASPRAAYISGTIVTIDGGQSLRPRA